MTISSGVTGSVQLLLILATLVTTSGGRGITQYHGMCLPNSAVIHQLHQQIPLGFLRLRDIGRLGAASWAHRHALDELGFAPKFFADSESGLEEYREEQEEEEDSEEDEADDYSDSS